MKRRSSANGVAERCTSPIVKRTKVQAQRKFAQGSNNFVTTPTKAKNIETTVQPSPETPAVESDDRELNNFSNLPTIDDFLTFLCYRETNVLPDRLNYLNDPQFETVPEKKKSVKVNSVPSPLPSSKSSTDHKASDKITNYKNKKKVPEYKLRSKDIKCKPIINKSSRSLALKHNQRLRKTVHNKFTDTKQNFKNKSTTNKFPFVSKNTNTNVKNNVIPEIKKVIAKARPEPKPEPIVKRVTRRNSNLNDLKPEPIKSTPKKTSKELLVAVENTHIPAKKITAKSFRVSTPNKSIPDSKPVAKSTRSATRLESNSKTPVVPVSTRPSRKTKEAATLYMETLGKDLLRGDESYDEDDDLDIASFLQLPSFESFKSKKECKSKPKEIVKKSPKKPDKTKPIKKAIKNDKQVEKLNDELKKIVEDEIDESDDELNLKMDDTPLKERLDMKKANDVKKLDETSKEKITVKKYDCIENIEIESADESNNRETKDSVKTKTETKPNHVESCEKVLPKSNAEVTKDTKKSDCTKTEPAKHSNKKPSIKIIRAKPKSNDDQVSASDDKMPKDTQNEIQTPKLVVLGAKEDDTEKPVIQTISTSNKMFCLESKKIIFKKNKTTVTEPNEDDSPRKAEAFSADNENSVYAFEPDLPTTSPPFRRLKSVTPPKSIISGNSIAVQVNFESNTKIECSSSSETQVTSTTDCDDRVFYIPIQTSDTNSTLGVAVKLDTDGANQKIIMSATLVTKSPSFTTTTATTVASRFTQETSSPEIIEVETAKKPTPKEIDKIVATADSQTSSQTPSDSPSSTVVSPKPCKKVSSTTKASQSVKIVKINKTKKLPTIKPKVKIGKPKNVRKPEPEKSVAGEILEAPTFYPSEAEFADPLKYIDTIRSVAEKYGLCRIVPPSTFRPECKVADEMRFTAYNQYVHKMLHRWGPNVKEMMAIRKFLATQNIQFTHPPWIGGMEVDLPRLYQIVQQCGGLKSVIEKERWHQVADVMKIPKLAQDRITKLDDIYCKYLLPYDILSHNEREKLFEEIEKEWNVHLKNANDDDEIFDDVDECIVKGRTMPLSCFYRIARNTMMMCFGNTEGQDAPSTETIETEFWNHVSQRKSHICVHSGSIDTGMHGYGFSIAKNSTFRKHPWNLKVLTNNSASILRSLGPIIGVTVPTLHVGMLYSACCWYRDPHGLPWIEYLHTGANKIWYGIPDEYSEQFRKAMMYLVPRYCRDKRLWLPSDTVMIPPPLLTARNVPLSRVVQQPGQFIVVFPKSFTSCISTGYMVSESVYFAHASWLNSAKQIFSDMQDSCEPSVFSLEQLLISVATDVRASLVILGKILPLLVELRDSEVAYRNQLEELGLTSSEKMKINKKRKSKVSFNDEDNYECEICRANLFVSLVINSHEQTNYCLKHAVILLQKKPAQVKYCKLMYAYTEDELGEIIDKVQQRMESKRSRKPNTKNGSM